LQKNLARPLNIQKSIAFRYIKVGTYEDYYNDFLGKNVQQYFVSFIYYVPRLVKPTFHEIDF